MCNVTIVLPVRDAEAILPATIQRILNLDYAADKLRAVCVEGDSIDGTWGALEIWEAQDSRVRLVKCNTGKPHYPSIVHPDRFTALAQVFNAGLDAVDLEWSTHVLMLPVDMAFGPDLLTRLLGHNVDLVSPFVWWHGVFWDTWAFTRGGYQFANFPRGTDMGATLLEMDTIGGTLLMRADVVRAGCRYTATDVDRGLCAQARAQGFRLWADPMTHVEHEGN